ncbi:lysoplasmalogenase [Cypionkella sp.]|uniref:lysoplasmalogenase n=1 Tax=Cypionkella sp. TaxID=2811411 RepID=UPI002AB7F8F2|nr:lysoplasmalogenase [Cypionkella sp.]MDZ4392151.1 lysoplasmalogenase [Cypionkella sp.]
MSHAIELVLLLLALVSFLSYWIFWAFRDHVNLTGAVMKTAATGLLAGLAFTHPVSGFQLIVLGLAFGALGDFALTRRSQTAFLVGMAAFAAGHLAYIVAFWLRARTIADAMPSDTALSGLTIAALSALAVLLLSTEVWLAPRTGPLRWPVRGDVVVIGRMGMTTRLLVPHPENAGATYLQIGAALFILSDLLLALRLFVFPAGEAAQKLSLALWPTYWFGQFLIMLGAGLYWLPFGL